MLKSNYHTHTKRCGHAYGEDIDYVKEALGAGFLNLGFSDHIFLPNFSQPGIRGEFSLFDNYLSSIRELSSLYQDRLKIFLGFEAEAFPLYYDYYHSILASKAVDYLILGNHYEMNSSKKLVTHFFKAKTASEIYRYRDLAISALSTNYFSCFAHPDYFLSSIENIDNDCKKVMRELVKVAVDLDIPLELNVAGIRSGKHQIVDSYRYYYPTELYLQTLHKFNAKVIIGQDAHAPNQLDDEEANFVALDLIKKYDLNVIDHLDFKKVS